MTADTGGAPAKQTPPGDSAPATAGAAPKVGMLWKGLAAALGLGRRRGFII